MDSIDPLEITRESEEGEIIYKKRQTDFVIKVEDTTIPVHKDFLCTVSEYFRAMVESDMIENEDGILEVKNTKEHVVQAVIKYFYGEMVSIPWNEVKQNVDFAELWQIPELKTSLEAYITENVSESDCIEWYYFAQMFNMEQLKVETKKVLSSDIINAFKQSAYLKGLEYEKVVDMIKDKELMSPSAALEACISWTMSEESRKPKFENLLTHVEIAKCNPGRLKYIVKLGLVTSPSVCMEINEILSSSIIILEQYKTSYPHTNIQRAVTLNTGNFFSADVSESFSRLPFNHHKDRAFHAQTTAGVFTTWGNEFILWDPVTVEFAKLPSLKFRGRSDRVTKVQVAVVKKNIYAMLEYIGSYRQQCAALVKLDIHSSDQWEEIPFPPNEGCDRFMCSEGKVILLFSMAAERDGVTETRLYCHDTDNDTWTEKVDPRANQPDFRFLAGAFSALGCLYFVGFRKLKNGTEEKQQRIMRYKVASDTWTEVCRPLMKCNLQNAVVLDQRVYALVDDNYATTGSHHHDWMQVYDIATDRWSLTRCKYPSNVNRSDVFCFKI